MSLDLQVVRNGDKGRSNFMGSSHLSRSKRGSLRVAPDFVIQGQHLSETQAVEECWKEPALVT